MRYFWVIFFLHSTAWAAPVMVCESPDGHVSLTSFPKGADLQTGWQRTVERNPALQGLPCTAVDDTTIQVARGKRYAWRMRQGKVQVDPTIPDPTPPAPVDIPVGSLGGIVGGALAGAGVTFLRGRKKPETP